MAQALIGMDREWMGRIVGIDYGLKRVGIAITDPLQLIATPLTTVLTTEAISFLQKYAQKEKITAFVVGFPGDLKDKFAPISVAIHKFVALLTKHFPAQRVFQQDERYTSKLAMDALVAGGFKKKDRRNKANIDKLSATLILQSFLQHHHYKNL